MRTLVWAVVLVIFAGVLLALPLFDLLGYELSFAMALAVTVAALDLSSQKPARSPSERAADDARPLRALLLRWRAATAKSWLVLLAPLALSLANGARVRNCDRPGGLLWFALLPVLSAVVASAVGVVVGRWGYLVFVGSLVWALWRFLAAPPVNAFDPFGGYFPGTLYDENVAVPAALWWARLYHLTAALAMMATAALFFDGSEQRFRFRAARRRSPFFAGLMVAAALALGLAGGRLGFSRSAADIARALGGEKRTEHFVLHYSPAGPFAGDLELHAADFEFRWHQLHELLGVDPGAPIHAFLFDSAAQKQLLMGAAHTSVAKPWRRELYLQHEAWPHPVVTHELAHVFAGAFGDPILHVSRAGLSLNVGLIEGVAVAASWHGSLFSGLTAHQQAQVMRKAGIAPPLEKVLGIRFLGFNNNAAYAEAGSFCRWLLDTYGAEKLERVYRDGGTSFAEVYGQPLPVLVAEWGRFVDGLQSPEGQQELARERLSQPTVFHKVCAHELAQKREEASHAAAAGDHARALRLLDEVCNDDPDDPDNLAERMDSARAGKLDDEAAATAKKLLLHPKVTPALRARAEALIGDLALARHDFDAARAAYARALALPLDESSGRLLTVKRLATTRKEPLLVRFLIEAPREPALMLATAEELTLGNDDSLYQYLFGRQLFERSQWARAADALELSRVGLPDVRFTREADRLAGIARFRVRQFDASLADFRRLADGAPEGVRLVAAEWIERIKWARK